jgi:hypothetical protein
MKALIRQVVRRSVESLLAQNAPLGRAESVSTLWSGQSGVFRVRAGTDPDGW